MKTIGVRELRQRASEYLKAVEQGCTLEVTARGRTVARLVPVRDSDRRRGLAGRGRLTLAHGDLLELGPPLPPAAGTQAPSKRLARSRADER
jgi:prevent-host-death family protein